MVVAGLAGGGVGVAPTGGVVAIDLEAAGFGSGGGIGEGGAADDEEPEVGELVGAEADHGGGLALPGEGGAAEEGAAEEVGGELPVGEAGAAGELGADVLEGLGGEVHGIAAEGGADHAGAEGGEPGFGVGAGRAEEKGDGSEEEGEGGGGGEEVAAGEGGWGEGGCAFGEDLRFEARGEGEVLQVAGDGVLEGEVLLEPALEVGVGPGEAEGFDDFGILVVGGARAVAEEDVLGGEAFHGLSFPPAARSRARSSRNWATPRESLDFTVPRGSSRIWAMSS